MKQTYELSLRQMCTLLDAQARLREVAEKTTAETRAGLERLAQALSPGLIDDLRKDNPVGVSQTPASALVDAIARDVKRRLSRVDMAEVTGKSVEELYERALADATRLRERAEKAEAEAEELRQWKKEMGSRFAVVQQALEDAQRRLGLPLGPPSQLQPDDIVRPTPAGTPLTPLLPALLPEWIQTWQSQDGYEHDLALLRLLAETGVARRKEAARPLSKQVKVDSSLSGGVRRSFQRLAEMGLIEQIEASSGASGASTHHLVRLTEQGRDTCRLLLGLEPVPSQMTELLARHESLAHAILNLEAADLLRTAGYVVDLFPGPVKLEEKRVFAPDLSASRQGRTLFVVVEWKRFPDHISRDEHWEDYYLASGGEFYVIVPNQPTFEKTKSDILYWAGQRRPLMLWMITMDIAKGKGDAVWMFKQGKPR